MALTEPHKSHWKDYYNYRYYNHYGVNALVFNYYLHQTYLP